MVILFVLQEDKTDKKKSFETYYNNQIVWNSSNEWWVMCNVDVSFNNQKETINKGWWVRDCLGRFIFGDILWDVGLLSTIEVEVIAIKEAV